MPGKTAAPHEIPYIDQGDSPPSAEEATKPMAERVHERLDDIDPSQVSSAGAGDEGKILVVQNTGVPAFKALSGDVTVDKDGKVEIGKGKVGTEEIADKALTTAKYNDKSITLGKLVDGLGMTEGYYADASLTSRKARLTSGIIRSTANVTLSASEWKDLTGATLEITPDVDSKILMWLSVQVQNAGEGGASFCSVSVDGKTDEEHTAGQAWGGGSIQSNYNGMTELYEADLTGGEKHTIKIRGKCVTGSGFTEHVATKGCALMYMLIAS